MWSALLTLNTKQNVQPLSINKFFVQPTWRMGLYMHMYMHVWTTQSTWLWLSFPCFQQQVKCIRGIHPMEYSVVVPISCRSIVPEPRDVIRRFFVAAFKELIANFPQCLKTEESGSTMFKNGRSTTRCVLEASPRHGEWMRWQIWLFGILRSGVENRKTYRELCLQYPLCDVPALTLLLPGWLWLCYYPLDQSHLPVCSFPSRVFPWLVAVHILKPNLLANSFFLKNQAA